MAQGRIDAACAAMRRVLVQASDPLERARLLPAHIEILLAAHRPGEARDACLELDRIAAKFDTGIPGALAAQARGAIELAEGDARAALTSLRRALEAWLQLEAPYEAARARVLIGQACLALGDEDGGELELDAARAAFARLGAAPDLARLDSLARRAAPPEHRLTARELQVLRLVAAGNTNKAIAAKLSLSERTIDRHLSNILAKLNVSSRSAATAYAYTHKLV
jgi:DNA-binding NarL/FixJ family response regulator